MPVFATKVVSISKITEPKSRRRANNAINYLNTIVKNSFLKCPYGPLHGGALFVITPAVSAGIRRM